MREFVHLHTHSHNSLLDGASTPQALVDRAVAIGQPALALTDHGSMGGVVSLAKAAKSSGIKPIFGNEVYIADDVTDKERTMYHLTLLAMNDTGLGNLYKLSSIGYDNFYYKPRLDIATLSQYSDGIIATTGCMGAPIPKAIAQGDMKAASDLMGIFLDIFGVDRYFVELQQHAGISELNDINRELIRLSKRFGLDSNFIATNDAHYARPEDAVPHDTFLCIQTGSKIADAKRMRFSDQGYYLKTADEMSAMFDDVPGALSNTLRVAEMCDAEIDTSMKMPDPYDDADTELTQYVTALSDSPAEAARIAHELSIITDMGFSSYFLIIKEICDEARKRGIWWNTRGSAAGSLVAQKCGITQVPPLDNGLIFERFLNPTRVNMPDIDLDFQYDRRDEIVRATLEMFGAENFASIATYTTFSGRSSINDAARVLGIDRDYGLMLSSNVVGMQSNETSAKDSITKGHPFFSERNYKEYTTNTQAKQLFDTAEQLHGLYRNSGVHACGVVMTEGDIRDFLPTQRQPRSVEGLGGLTQVTQWPMKEIDELGFLKIDFLGLKTLSVMVHACRLIEERYGVKYDMSNIPYEAHHIGPDPTKKATALFELLQAGDVAGVFQVEGEGMEALMRDMQPYDFQHIVAAVALFRPGPMDNIPTFISRLHGEKFEYAHPDLEPILGDTFGVMVYQEQIIQVAVQIAGYEAGEADKIRKAVGKKIKAQLDAHKDKFINGCVANGYGREIGESIWADIEFFARYGFNRAHAASYAMITCMTAFLKAHYRDEYLTALLTNEAKDTDKISQYASRMKLKVTPPNIQVGNLDFEVNNGVVVYGLASIKNTQLKILRELAKAAPFESIGDMAERVDLSKGKKTLEALAYAGALDEFGSRQGIVSIVPAIQKTSKSTSKGQLTLFSSALSLAVPSIVDDKLTCSLKQRELTGIYFNHPAVQYETGMTIADILSHGEVKTDYRVACMIDEADIRIAKTGNPYAIGTVSDATATSTFKSFGDRSKMVTGMYEQNNNEVYVMRVRLSIWNDRRELVIESLRRASGE